MLADYVPYLRSLWTVWFFAVFAFLVISALLPHRRAQYEHTSRIPLNDDPNALSPQAGRGRDPARVARWEGERPARQPRPRSREYEPLTPTLPHAGRGRDEGGSHDGR